MTRDHNGWWWVMGIAALAVLSTDPHMVTDLVSGDVETTAQAVVKLLGLIFIGGAGVARMSPFNISPEGRRKAIRRDTGHLPKASIAAAVANVAAAEAADVTKDAAAKAEIAKDLAKPGSDK